MYIDNSGRAYYSSDGGQRHSRASFLILMQIRYEDKPISPEEARPRGIVRKVALRQLGHWMMGTARIHGHSITVSGVYGGDGLLCRVPRDVFLKGVPLPDDLYEAWKNGGGHNSAGSEAPAMREWALRTLVPKR